LKKIKLPRIFFGWWTVITGGILALWGYGYQAYGFSALFKPMSEELGFNRAMTSVAASIGRFQGGIEAPLAGWITDRFGPRWIVITGVCAMSIGLIAMRYAQSLWSYYVFWGVLLGMGANIALSLPMDTAISNWFVKKRGLAISIKWVFSGLSGVAILPIISWLIETQGWRDTVFIGGVVMAAVGIPLAWFFLKQHRPEYYGLLPDGAVLENSQGDMIARGVEYATEVHEVEFTVRQAMRTRVYWLMIVAQAVTGLVAPVMSIHSIPFLTDPQPGGMGIDAVQAAGMMSIWVAASLPSRFIFGNIADRMSYKYLHFILVGSYLLQAIGVFIYLQSGTLTSVYIWFVLYGIGQGAPMTVNPLMRARYFGRKSFGSIAGISRAFITPVGVLGPIYAGWIYDTTGSYETAFVQFAIALAVSSVLAIFLFPPAPPEEVTGIYGKVGTTL
jgi:OFA family oxalate/formate antiporter-like MFS transporter